MAYRHKLAVSAIFFHSKQEKTYQEALETHRVKAQPWSINGPYMALKIFQIFQEGVNSFLGPLNNW